ncbi:MAG: hypothetical protein AAF960_01445 [Bacteroidota bacterium]
MVIIVNLKTTMMVNWNTLFVKLYCWWKGYRIENINTPVQYKEVFDLINDSSIVTTVCIL